MLYNTLRQYEYLVAVADTGSLTEAANVLNISQPSLSVALTRLEQRFGQSVFIRRKGAALEITPFGYQTIKRARELLQSASDLELGTSEYAPFILGCFEDIAPWYLAPALENLKTAFPDLKFQGQEGRFSGLATSIAEGRVDLAISYDVGFEGHFERRKTREVAPVAFLHPDHPLATEPNLELSQLADYPILLSSESLSENFVRNLFADIHLPLNVVQRTTSLEMMRSLTANGFGIGISYSRPPTDISYDGKPLVTVPISTPHAMSDIVLVWSRLRKPDPQFKEILNILA